MNKFIQNLVLLMLLITQFVVISNSTTTTASKKQRKVDIVNGFELFQKEYNKLENKNTTLEKLINNSQSTNLIKIPNSKQLIPALIPFYDLTTKQIFNNLFKIIKAQQEERRLVIYKGDNKYKKFFLKFENVIINLLKKYDFSNLVFRRKDLPEIEEVSPSLSSSSPPSSLPPSLSSSSSPSLKKKPIMKKFYDYLGIIPESLRGLVPQRRPPGAQPGAPAPIRPHTYHHQAQPRGLTAPPGTGAPGAPRPSVAPTGALTTIPGITSSTGLETVKKPQVEKISGNLSRENTKDFFKQLKNIIKISKKHLSKKVEIANDLTGEEIISSLSDYKLLKKFNYNFYKLLNDFINENDIETLETVDDKLRYVEYSKIVNNKINTNWPSREQLNQYDILLKTTPAAPSSSTPSKEMMQELLKRTPRLEGKGGGTSGKPTNIYPRNKGITPPSTISPSTIPPSTIPPSLSTSSSTALPSPTLPITPPVASTTEPKKYNNINSLNTNINQIIDNLIKNFIKIEIRIDEIWNSKYKKENFFKKVSELDFLREFNRDMYKLLNNYFMDDDYIKNKYYIEPPPALSPAPPQQAAPPPALSPAPQQAAQQAAPPPPAQQAAAPEHQPRLQELVYSEIINGITYNKDKLKNKI